MGGEFREKLSEKSHQTPQLESYERVKQGEEALCRCPSLTKSAFETLLRPLFGQFQKGCSRRLKGDEEV